MLKKLKRHTYQMKMLIENLSARDTIVQVSCADPEKIGIDITKKIDDLYLKYGFRDSGDPNPSFYTVCRPDTTKLKIVPLLQDAIAVAVVYTGMDKDTGVATRSLWMTFLSCIVTVLGHRPIFCHSDQKDENRDLFVHILHDNIDDIRDALLEIEQVLGISLNISFVPANVPQIQQKLFLSLQETENFYIFTEPEWTQTFYDNLGDDLSRASLLNFIRQRMWAQVFWACTTYYTLSPNNSISSVVKATFWFICGAESSA